MSNFYTKEGTNEQMTEILRSSMGLVKPIGGLLIKSGSRPIRTGEILATDSTTNQSMPVKSTQLASAAANAQAEVVVDDAHAFEVGDVIKVGDATGTYTILSIDYDTNTITLSTSLSGGTDPHPVNGRVHSDVQARNDAVAIALTPVKDRENSALANRHGAFVFGDCAIKGTFKKSAIKNFHSDMDTDFGGKTLIADTYVI